MGTAPALITITVNIKRMNAKRKTQYSMLLLLLIISVVACSKMDEEYKEFTKGGEIIYTGKIDSLKIFPGRNRFKLAWALVSDQRITKCRVFWNEGEDSVTVPVTRTAGVDHIDVTINDLEERTYTFEVVTYDDAGHHSIPVDTLGNVYGDAYQATLFNRPVKRVSFKKDSSTVVWSGASSTNVRVELSYLDTLDIQRSYYVPKADTLIKLPAFRKGNTFRYRTVYLPHPNSLDTFYSAYGDWLIP
jgi:hypothetical protein